MQIQFYLMYVCRYVSTGLKILFILPDKFVAGDPCTEEYGKLFIDCSVIPALIL